MGVGVSSVFPTIRLYVSDVHRVGCDNRHGVDFWKRPALLES